MVGASGAIVDLSALNYLVAGWQWGPLSARVVSMSLSLTLVFLCNRSFTFRSGATRGVGNQVARFLLAYATGIAVNFALYAAFLWIGVHYTLAGALAIGLGAVWNYALSHRFVFAS